MICSRYALQEPIGFRTDLVRKSWIWSDLSIRFGNHGLTIEKSASNQLFLATIALIRLAPVLYPGNNYVCSELESG